MDHLPASAVQRGLAREQHFLAAGEFFLHVGLIEPHRPQIEPALANQHAQERPAGAGVSQLGFFDHAANRDQLVCFQIGDAAQIGEVLIIARKVEQHIRDCLEIELPQQFGPRRPDAFEKLHRRMQRFRRRRSGSRRSAVLETSIVGSACDMEVV